MSLNKAMLIGNLGRDPELRTMPSGQAVVNFSIATDESYVDQLGVKQEKVEWHNVVAFGKLAQLCAEHLRKGRQVFVEGRLHTREWQDKEQRKHYRTEIVASHVQFLGAPPADAKAVAEVGEEAASDEAPL